jgi:hypothetical protein
MCLSNKTFTNVKQYSYKNGLTIFNLSENKFLPTY